MHKVRAEQQERLKDLLSCRVGEVVWASHGHMYGVVSPSACVDPTAPINFMS